MEMQAAARFNQCCFDGSCCAHLQAPAGTPSTPSTPPGTGLGLPPTRGGAGQGLSKVPLLHLRMPARSQGAWCKASKPWSPLPMPTASVLPLGATPPRPRHPWILSPNTTPSASEPETRPWAGRPSVKPVHFSQYCTPGLVLCLALPRSLSRQPSPAPATLDFRAQHRPVCLAFRIACNPQAASTPCANNSSGARSTSARASIRLPQYHADNPGLSPSSHRSPTTTFNSFFCRERPLPTSASKRRRVTACLFGSASPRHTSAQLSITAAS